MDAYRACSQTLMDNYKSLDAKTISHVLSVFAFSDKLIENTFTPTTEMLNRLELAVSTNMQDYMGNDGLANVLVAFLRLGYRPSELIWQLD